MKERCALCGRELPPGEGIEFRNHVYCQHCLDQISYECTECGRRILRDSHDGFEDYSLCYRCYNEYYTTCSHCGTLIRLDETIYDDDDEDHDYPYCRDCAKYHNAIRGYYYKPEPIFYGEDAPRYLGVELEVDCGGERVENAYAVLQVINHKNPLAYCKHDGSLSDGFEIVTHPMTLAFHQNSMPWQDAVDTVRRMGYRSHKAGTCGLHIHVNRDSLGETWEEQDQVIARILYFVEKHWEELLKFSRRTQTQLDRWASRYGYKDSPWEILDKAKGHCGRYTCVNLGNEETVEFRIFRGTLKYNTIIATLQLVNRICNVAFLMSDRELKDMSWTTFVSGCTQPELIQYLKERQLYINEPVSTEEEV